MPEDTSKNNLDLATRLMLERTRMTYEKSMLAWIGTATSLITFGFSIYKFAQMLRTREEVVYFDWSHIFSLLMIGVGLLSLLFACFEYWQNYRELKKHYFPGRYSLALVVAFLIVGLGIIALIMMFREI